MSSSKSKYYDTPNRRVIKKITFEQDRYEVLVSLSELKYSGKVHILAKIKDNEGKITQTEKRTVRNVIKIPFLFNYVELSMKRTLKKAAKKLGKRQKKLRTADEADISEEKIKNILGSKLE